MWVFVDFFDTIVHRNCNSEVPLFVWTKRVIDEYRLDIEPKELYRIRKEIEGDYRNRGIEIKYDELINLIYDKFKGKNAGLADNSLNGFIKWNLDTECKIEIEHVFIDDTIKNCLDSYKETDSYHFAIISDYYLPADVLKNILCKIGLEGYFEKIYVSCEWNARKSTGELFKTVLNDIGINAEDAIMIGDNQETDIKMASQIGMKTVIREYLDVKPYFDKKQIKRELGKLFSIPKNASLIDVHSNYAISMYIFAERLYTELRKENFKKVFFFSREGYMLKRIFDEYQKKIYGEVKIESIYLFVSRRATLMPSLKPLENEDFKRLFRQYKNIIVKDFMGLLGLAQESIDAICKEEHISDTDCLTEQNRNDYLNRFRVNKTFSDIYENLRGKARKNFIGYLNGQGIAENGRYAVSDIGWAGSIQDSLYDTFDGKIEFIGYYYGLHIPDDFTLNNSNTKRGLVYEYKKPASARERAWEANTFISESICMAPHGPTRGYHGIDVNYTPIVEDDDGNIKLYELIEPYQERILEKYNEIIILLGMSLYSYIDYYKIMYIGHISMVCNNCISQWLLCERIKESNLENFIQTYQEKRLKGIKHYIEIIKKRTTGGIVCHKEEWIEFMNNHKLFGIMKMFSKALYIRYNFVRIR